jgi:hypothetical protein
MPDSCPDIARRRRRSSPRANGMAINGAGKTRGRRCSSTSGTTCSVTRRGFCSSIAIRGKSPIRCSAAVPTCGSRIPITRRASGRTTTGVSSTFTAVTATGLCWSARIACCAMPRGSRPRCAGTLGSRQTRERSPLCAWRTRSSRFPTTIRCRASGASPTPRPWTSSARSTTPRIWAMTAGGKRHVRPCGAPSHNRGSR